MIKDLVQKQRKNLRQRVRKKAMFNVDENLSFQPYFENDAIFNQNLGIKLKITL